jgi:hypothetical protein
MTTLLDTFIFKLCIVLGNRVFEMSAATTCRVELLSRLKNVAGPGVCPGVTEFA